MAEESQKSQSLETISIVPPKDVTIVGSYDEDRETFIAIHNPVKQLVAFKLKPSGVSVKPRFGYIRSKGETFIKVRAPAVEIGEKPSTKDYIKITLACAPKDHPAKPRDFWKECTDATMLNRKLRILYKLEDEGTVSSDSASSASESSEKGSEKSKPSPTSAPKRRKTRAKQ